MDDGIKKFNSGSSKKVRSLQCHDSVSHNVPGPKSEATGQGGLTETYLLGKSLLWSNCTFLSELEMTIMSRARLFKRFSGKKLENHSPMQLECCMGV